MVPMKHRIARTCLTCITAASDTSYNDLCLFNEMYLFILAAADSSPGNDPAAARALDN